MRGSRFRIAWIGAAAVGVAGCTAVHSNPMDTGDEPVLVSSFAPTPAQYSWFLPKTVIDATVSYTLRSCKTNGSTAQIEASITPTFTSRAVPDRNIGPYYPNGLITVTPEELKSFWQDRSITVKTFPNSHILQTLGSQTENQAVTIISNTLQGITRLAAVAMGVSPAAMATLAEKKKEKDEDPLCGEAVKTLKTIKELQQKLRDPATPEEEAKFLLPRIQALQASITIKIETTIDPGLSPLELSDKTGIRVWTRPISIPSDGRIATIGPSAEAIEKAKWLAAAPEWVDKKLFVDVRLDFTKAYPAQVAACSGGRTSCPRHRGQVGPGTLFREVAYLPMTVRQHGEKDLLINPTTIAFGQFGIPRSLPLSSGLFEKLGWSVTFSDSGEITDAQFSSKATGLGLSQLFATSASAVNSIATQARNADAATDPDTLRLEAQNKALQARIQSIKLNRELQGLIAQGD